MVSILAFLAIAKAVVFAEDSLEKNQATTLDSHPCLGDMCEFV